MSDSYSNILAIDASTELGSVALRLGEQIWVRECDTPRSHAKVLLGLVDELLVEAKTSINKLDAIAVNIGPGSFTGIRICIGIAQGLAYGAQIPLISASSLEVMAYKAAQNAQKTVIVPALDARMNEVYWQAFQLIGDQLNIIHEAVVTAPKDLSDFTQKQPDINAVGHGWNLDSADLEKPADADADVYPTAEDALHYLHSLSAEQLERRTHKAQAIEPLYLRNEVAWEKRKRIREQSST